MSKKTRKDELLAVIAIARDELDVINLKEQTEKELPFVGKYFKYPNSYGNGEHWWLYKAIKKFEMVHDSAYLLCDEWEVISDSKFQVSFSTHTHIPRSPHIEITKEEYEEAWARAIADLKTGKFRLNPIADGEEE